MATYKGFSTKNWKKNRTFAVSDFEAVKEDLLNHIFTIKGERAHMPNFGTRIPLLTFEPNDEITRSIIDEDLRTVFDYDPRVQLIALNIMSLPDNNAMIAIADLLYLEFNVTDVLRIEVQSQ